MRNIVRASEAGLGALPCAALALIVLALAAGPPARADDAGARRILKAMSDYMASQKTLAADFDADLEIITPQIEKLQFSASGKFQLSRPNRLHVVRTGGYSDVELVFDGETATVLNRATGSYAQVKMPGDIDQLLDGLDHQHGINPPGADVLMAGSFQALTAGVIEAKHMGRGVIDGVEAEHLAFRNADTDWQIWVQVGDRPLPLKYVIVSKTLAAAPEYQVRVHNWKVGAPLNSTDFVFTPPKGAKAVPLESLKGIGDLPEQAPTGGKP